MNSCECPGNLPCWALLEDGRQLVRTLLDEQSIKTHERALHSGSWPTDLCYYPRGKLAYLVPAPAPAQGRPGASKFFHFLPVASLTNPGRTYEKYLSPDLQVIDDFGLAAPTAMQAEDLYEIVSQAHLRLSWEGLR